MFGPSIPEVSPANVPDGAYLVDVREVNEWEQGHAPSAVLVPMSQITGRLDEIPSDGTVYVICAGGVRSAEVAAWLIRQGRDAVNVAGGMNDWMTLGLPVVR
ncbi:MAG: rhodanese-like domain-containing protein [Actinobacteria bacterium]|nr:rhodanese-like domain-containing protein [Actinomycetota bacterium]